MPLEEILYTFDDVTIQPAYSKILPSDVSLQTSLTPDITLNIPLISAAMDTVTESPLAIAIAEEGGIGIIHKNMSIEEQADEVRKVKKFISGVVTNPITVTPDSTISDLKQIRTAHNISSMPVVEKKILMGIITSRDIRFEQDPHCPVHRLMTPKKHLITVSPDTAQSQVIKLFKKHRIEKVLIVDDNFSLQGMYTIKDILRAQEKPYSCRCTNGQLRVGAAVGIDDFVYDRVSALLDAHADVIVVDTAHGHSRFVLNTIEKIRTLHPHIQLIGGNVVTGSGAQALVNHGVDAVKVGMGLGSICTTRIVTGVGIPQISALQEVSHALAAYNIPIIADGGIRYSGDINKAIAAGAWTAMIGSLFAGTHEAPGETILYQGRSYKEYRGMGSLAAMQQGSSDRYFQNKNTTKLVPEGIEGRVPYRGSLSSVVQQLLGGIRAGMGYTGSQTIKEFRTKTILKRISNASIKASHVHDVFITKEAPNYHLE